MGLIDIPQPAAAPNVAGSMRNRGAISAASAEANMWNQVAGLGWRIRRKGEQIEAEAEAWQRQQDNFAIDMASNQIKFERDRYGMEVSRRDDLGQFDKDGVIGYDRAVMDYGSHLEDVTSKAASQIPTRYREMWLARERQENEYKTALFEMSMVDQRSAQNTIDWQKEVRRLASGAGEVPADPMAAIQFAAKHIDVLPEDERETSLSWAREQVVYGLMNDPNHGPADAMAFLEQAKDQFEPKDWSRLKASVNAKSRDMQAEVNAESRGRAYAFNDAATRAILSGQTQLEDGQGNTIGLRDAIKNHPDLTGSEKRALASSLDAMIAAKGRKEPYSELDILNARIEVDQAKGRDEKLAVLKRNAPILGETRALSLYEKINSGPSGEDVASDALDATVSAIRSYATNRIKTYGEEQGLPDADVESQLAQKELELGRIQAGIIQQWEDHPDWTVQQKLDSMKQVLVPVKEDQAKKIVEQASIRNRVRTLFPLGSDKPAGWESTMGYGFYAQEPTGPTKTPTADELRKKNTKEAYEQGVKLGYWK